MCACFRWKGIVQAGQRHGVNCSERKMLLAYTGVHRKATAWFPWIFLKLYNKLGLCENLFRSSADVKYPSVHLRWKKKLLKSTVHGRRQWTSGETNAGGACAVGFAGVCLESDRSSPGQRCRLAGSMAALSHGRQSSATDSMVPELFHQPSNLGRRHNLQSKCEGHNQKLFGPRKEDCISVI